MALGRPQLRAAIDPACWQDGSPTEYKSWTRFYGCTAQRLCAFYLDCEHLASWETMVKSYASLEFDAQTGHEVGRMVKKYPLCSPREYVLAWRVWRGPSDGPTATYYCVTQVSSSHGLAAAGPTSILSLCSCCSDSCNSILTWSALALHFCAGCCFERSFVFWW